MKNRDKPVALITVGDYVLPVLKAWMDKGFTKPKKVLSVRDKCANCGDGFNGCHLMYLKKVKQPIPQLLQKGEMTIVFDYESDTQIGFSFGFIARFL